MDEEDVEAALTRAKLAIAAYVRARREMEEAREALSGFLSPGDMVALNEEIDSVRPDMN